MKQFSFWLLSLSQENTPAHLWRLHTCTVSGAGFTLYMLYIAECTVHTELVLCPVLCTAFVVYSTVSTLYCVRCCVDVSGLASERSHQLYHVYCILYSVCTVAGAVLTCLAWLVRGPTSCGWPWRTELGRSSSSSPSPAPQGSLHQQYSIHITPNT